MKIHYIESHIYVEYTTSMCRSLDTVAYCLQYAMLLCFPQAYCQSLHKIILPHIVKAYIVSDAWLNHNTTHKYPRMA